MELISRSDTWRKFISEIEDIADLEDIDRILNSMPTIEECKEGEWLDNKWLGKKCSVCSWELHYINFGQFKYCPNCGARMKGTDL